MFSHLKRAAYSAVICMMCFMGVGLITHAQATVKPHAAYITIKEDTPVRKDASSSAASIGTIVKNAPAIVTGMTDNGWLQIYYIGQFGFVPASATTDYVLNVRSLTRATAPLKINALGDSITYGDKLADSMSGYAPLVSAMLGAEKFNNYGLNGSAVGGLGHVDTFLSRYPMMDRDANLILVFGGTNDYEFTYMAGTPLGQLGDFRGDTFYGALNYLMCGLKQMYPNSEIVFMTPLKRVYHNRPNLSGHILSQYADAILETAPAYGIKVIDLFHAPELDFISNSKTYLVDGLHPNVRGHSAVATYVYHELTK